MFKLHRVLLAAALVAMTSSTSMAGYLGAGGLQGGGGMVTFAPPGSNLFNATTLTVNSAYVITGAFDSLASLIPGVSDAPVVLDVNNPGAYTLKVNSNPTDKFEFQGVSIVADTSIGSPTLGSRTIIMKGTATLSIYDAGNNLIEVKTGAANVVLGFTAAGDGRISTSFSLNVVPIPEPSSVALAGIGLAAAGLFGLRKRLAK